MEFYFWFSPRHGDQVLKPWLSLMQLKNLILTAFRVTHQGEQPYVKTFVKRSYTSRIAKYLNKVLKDTALVSRDILVREKVKTMRAYWLLNDKVKINWLVPHGFVGSYLLREHVVGFQFVYDSSLSKPLNHHTYLSLWY